uniref:Uncharacterized protein n=1 Tax=Hyaloperonospora arabidopsidis (strain Emoy2) TaxID=559515 RepID=M4C284_HYAAE
MDQATASITIEQTTPSRRRIVRLFGLSEDATTLKEDPSASRVRLGRLRHGHVWLCLPDCFLRVGVAIQLAEVYDLELISRGGSPREPTKNDCFRLSSGSSRRIVACFI